VKLKGIPIKGVKLKDGKIVEAHRYRDASHAIRAKKCTRARVVRRQTP
jgi:hypothetical protein